MLRSIKLLGYGLSRGAGIGRGEREATLVLCAAAEWAAEPACLSSFAK